jgi:hypothetical protein
MNRFERNIGFKGEAKLKYLDGEVQVHTRRVVASIREEASTTT